MNNSKGASSPQAEKGMNSIQFMILTGVVMGICMGFFDVMTSICRYQPGAFSSFSLMLTLSEATALVLFLVYIGLWFIIGMPLRRLFKLETHPLLTALAIFLSIFFILTRLEDLIRFPVPGSSDLLKLFVFFLTSLYLAVIVYFSGKIICRLKNITGMVNVIILTLVFVLFCVLLFLWIDRYLIGSESIFRYLLIVGLLVIIHVTLRLLLRRAERIKVTRLLLSLMIILIIINPAITLIEFEGDQTGHTEARSALGRIKRILLISVDTLRPDFLSCYNPQTGNTPNIDQLAEDGILFRRAISSSPWTLPSMASIMTGLPNAVHTATKPFTPLPDTLQTLAEIMRDNGYMTAAIGDNQFLKPMYNVSQGFREYNFFPKPEQFVGYSLGAKIVFTWLFPRALLDEATTTDLTRFTLDWIESNRDHDFFFWLHYFDPHMPYKPPQPYLPSIGWILGTEALDEIRSGKFVPNLTEREGIRMLYNGEIHYVDDNIGHIIDALREYNLYDESLIILTSDHGEEFWEHGGFEHGHTLYDEVIHVPLIVKLPASLSGTYQRQISTTVSIQCILPTILELCGIAYDDGGIKEQSLIPLWDAKAGKYQIKPVFSSSLIYYEDRESVIFDEKKYIRFLMTDGEELYDLKRDPAEQMSLALSRFREREIGKDLLEMHRNMAEEIKAAMDIEETRKVELDEETLKRLRTLGYVK